MYLRVDNWIILKDSKSSQSIYVHFDQHFDVFDILQKLIGYIFNMKKNYTARSFFAFHTTWSYSNKAVQQADPLIATHKSDKALKMFIKKINAM